MRNDHAQTQTQDGMSGEPAVGEQQGWVASIGQQQQQQQQQLQQQQQQQQQRGEAAHAEWVRQQQQPHRSF